MATIMRSGGRFELAKSKTFQMTDRMSDSFKELCCGNFPSVISLISTIYVNNSNRNNWVISRIIREREKIEIRNKLIVYEFIYIIHSSTKVGIKNNNREIVIYTSIGNKFFLEYAKIKIKNIKKFENV